MQLTEALIITNIAINVAMALLAIIKAFKKSSCVSITQDGKKREITIEMTPNGSESA